MLKEHIITDKEKKYCDELLLCGNAVQAAKNAGYAPSTATKLVHMWIGKSRQASGKPHLWDYMQKKREALENEYNVTKGKVLEGFHRIATFDLRRLYDDFGDMLPLNEWPDEAIAAIEGFEVQEMIIGDGLSTKIKKVKVGRKNEAWANIAKMLGYNAAEKVQHDVTESFLDFLKQTSAGGKG